MTQELLPYTVTQLNRQIRSWLEHDFGRVAVNGEMSNVSSPASGHLYFTLKDSQAQLRCVYFRNQHTKASANLGPGQQVIATGCLSLYEARGDYQLIVQTLVPSGLGALFQQFEQLKQKLQGAGLFDTDRKKTIAHFPNIIAVITSETGAALQDILSTLARRYPIAKVLIYPSEVQGKNAGKQLTRALLQANKDGQADTIILARGGGSMEDLWPFNNEELALAISQSKIPIISGVGHETDFSIADFVADLRAETPTAAAQRATPDKMDLLHSIANIIARLERAITKIMEHYQLVLSHCFAKITSPKELIYTYWQRLDYTEQQLRQLVSNNLQRKHHQLALVLGRLQVKNPASILPKYRLQLQHIRQQLTLLIQKKIDDYKQNLARQFSNLHNLSPLATFERGYAIASYQHAILYSSQQVNLGDSIKLQLAKGRLTCLVTQKEDEPDV
jgi:exodeoxyribonuclease VII large subunit